MSDPAAGKRKAKEGGGKKKKKAKSSIPSGTVLFCGSTTWAASVDAKDEKKILQTPHKIAAMAGRQVSKVVMGPVALSGVILTKQGSAFTFGRNDAGQLGLGDEKTRTFPRKVDLDHVVDAACGRRHTLFLTDQGKIYATGSNISGQLGLGEKKLEQISTPKRVPFEFGSKIIKVACGAEFSMALTEAGDVFAWGHPDKGCLGNGTDGKYFITASKLTFHFEFAPIMVSGWCEKVDGALGEGREKAEMQPVSKPKIVDIACGPEHTVAMTDDGNIFTWGFGGYGRLGHSSPDNELYPRLIEHFKPTNPHTKGCSSMTVGGSCAIVMTKALGHPYFWGQLKSSGEATMYPKVYSEGMGEPLTQLGLGNKHVVLGTESAVYSLGSSPCYGELGYGEGEKRSSTVFKPMGPVAEVPIIGVACGYAQTLMIADLSTREARKAMYQLPTLGTLSEIHTINELSDEAADVLEDDNFVIMLDNVQQIVELITATDDKPTIKKLKGAVIAKVCATITALFTKLKASFEGGAFVPTGPNPDEVQQAAATAYVKDLIEKNGTNAEEIAASITGALLEKVEA